MAKTFNPKEWDRTDFPNFKGRKIYVLPGSGYVNAVKMFTEAGLLKAESVNDADVVCFLGGADISPSYYGQKPHSTVRWCDTARDAVEKEVYNVCTDQSKIMFGICRGAQFLHVMNGGKLWQDVDNHAIAVPHLILDVAEDVIVPASSTHHQMMRLNEEMMLLACCPDNIASYFKDDKEEIENDGTEVEVEACVYYGTKSLCIQGHPEQGPPRFKSWSLTKLHDFVTEWEAPSEINNLDFLNDSIAHLI